MSESPAPRFTVVVPAYNAALTLGETLDAIGAQTLQDWHAIVVDDGSTDETLAIATAMADRDPRIHAIHQANQGAAGAYNCGVQATTTEWVVMCSADDLLLPGHLEQMQAFMLAEPGYDIYSCDGYYLDPDGARFPVHESVTAPCPTSCTLADALHYCFYGVGAIYRRELWERIGGYRVGVFGEDYDFWLRALASGAKHRFNPEPLSLHRRSATQKSANLEQAYLSDIRLISDLEANTALTAEERVAAEQGRAIRHRMIAELHSPSLKRRNDARQAIAEAAARLLGEERVHRIARWRRRPVDRPGDDR